MRWRALQEGVVFVKQNINDSQIDVTDIQEMISNRDKQLADRIMKYGEGLRGSVQFWMGRRRELLDMIKQIRHRGLLFFTFSAADFHWSKLHKLMLEDGYSAADESISSETRQKNIINNPHIATWFFHRRFENFFNDVLKPRWDLEDWWYRFE
jgi:hypothetical protein